MRITKKQDQRIRKQVDRIREINKYYTKEDGLKREIKLEVTPRHLKPTTDKKEINEILRAYEHAIGLKKPVRESI